MNAILKKIWSVGLRPVLAWLAACWVAGLVLFLTYLVADNGLGDGLARHHLGFFEPFLAATFLGLFVAVFTAMPVGFLVALARRFRWPRGQAELVTGALIPFLVLSIFFGSQYNTFTDSMSGILLAATYIPAGLAGGFIYWYLAGRQ